MENKMNHCKRCNIDIIDNTEVCPLCDHVLTQGTEKNQRVYPDVWNKTRGWKRLVTIFSYFLVVLEIACCIINYYTYQHSHWSVITGICFAYIIFTMCYSFNRRNGHIRKIFVQAAGAIVLLLALDYVTGAGGWSVSYGLPCMVLLLDGILVVCMLANFQNWQSYLLVQLFALLVSIALLVLLLTGVTKGIVLIWVAFGISALIFSFCFTIGYRKAKNELRRRFFI